MSGPAMARSAMALLAFLFIILAAPLARAADPPLVAAAKSGDAAAITSLLADGADPNSADSDQLTALNWAAYNGHLEVVRALVQHGAQVDPHASKSGWTPLMNASAQGFDDIAAYLIAHRANINARSADGGYTPLMYAARKSRRNVVTLLVNSGADINDTCDDKRTALNFADLQDDGAIGALLVAHGGVRMAVSAAPSAP